ncbi:hypothetical protein [Flavobacterium undicola]|uniref:hypothetical protein n=1 Tax=Flavobacterium undicola TaxID=1932779 RepID=UPI001378A7CA|nr:hypothetical protein [Flavobacterium undicola]MBA0882688.1 hypothetical protein [Flavobacterium undicola]
MEQIQQIYLNSLGIAFYWEKGEGIIPNRVQLIFKEIGLFFSIPELREFEYLIDESIVKNRCCEDCALKNGNCKFLLKTPLYQIDLSVSMDELNKIKDLVNGTLFRINMESYLNGEGKN